MEIVIAYRLRCLTFVLLEALLHLLDCLRFELVAPLFVELLPSLAEVPLSATIGELKLPLMGLVLL